MDLTPDERQKLKDLLDQLIAATEGRTFWLNQVRETSIELRDLLNEWLETEASDSQLPNTDALPERDVPAMRAEARRADA